MTDDTITTLPVGERRGKNHLIKFIVDVTFTCRVYLASSTEGISVPKSAPSAAFATIVSNRICLFLMKLLALLID
jgi:hypothetical protein